MAAHMGPVTIGCPGCGERLPVPCKVVLETPHTRTVLVRMDYTAAREHFSQCAGQTQPANLPAKAEGQVPAFVHPGTRACTMCGTPARECLENTRRRHVGCCGGCTVGDTHPVPRGHMTCAEWGAEHGASQDAQH